MSKMHDEGRSEPQHPCVQDKHEEIKISFIAFVAFIEFTNISNPTNSINPITHKN